MEPLRKCIDCGLEAYTEHDLCLFVSSPESAHKRKNLCKPCSSLRSRIDQLSNPERTHRNKMKHQHRKRYGVTREVYEERMASSDKCECCGSKENLCYDHCHESMDFRGVLCRGCNAAIGGLGDTEEGVLKALAYLINHRERQNEDN